MYTNANLNFNSYVYNGINTTRTAVPVLDISIPSNFPGLAGKKTTEVRNTTTTIAIGEFPAYQSHSWHKSLKGKAYTSYNNAEDLVIFVDGHVSMIKIYWPGSGTASYKTDPPAGYDYQWSGTK